MPIATPSAATGGGIEAGRAFVDVFPNMKTFGPALQRDLPRQLQTTEQKMQRVGSTMTKTLTPAATAFGVFAISAFRQADAGLDTLRAKTGATGKEFANLEKSFKDVAGNVTQPLEQIGDTMAQLAQRTKLTGDPLERLTIQMLNLERIRMPLSVSSATRLFGDWSVSTDYQAEALERLFRASQETGTEIEGLASLAVRFGAPMRQMGFSLEETIGLLGKFEQEGVNTQLVMGSMRIALGKLAREGVQDVPGEFRKLVTEIENAGSAGDANAKALELFGARAGPDMAAAIREGRFELGDLVKIIRRGDDTINETTSDTEDWIDRLQKLKNVVQANIGPVGEYAFAISALAGVSGPMVSWIGRMREARKASQALAMAQPVNAVFGISGAAANASAALDGLTKGFKGLGIAAAGFVAVKTTQKIDETFESAAYNAGQADTAMGRFSGRFSETLGPVSAATGAWENLNLALKGEKDWLSALSPLYDTLKGDNESLEEHVQSLNDRWLAGKISLDEYRAAIKATGVEIGGQSEFIEKNSDVALLNRQRNARLAETVAGVGDVFGKVAKKVNSFAGMTGEQLATWKTETTASLDGVGSALGDLADEAKLSTREILRRFRREAEAITDLSENLETLAGKGYPADFTKQLSEMGLEGALVAERLADAKGKMRDKIIGALGDVEKAEKHFTDFTKVSLGDAAGSVKTGFGDMLGATRDFTSAFQGAINIVREKIGLDTVKVSQIPIKGFGGAAYHSGGEVGKDGTPHRGPLRSDEQLTVLQKGEYVIDRDTWSKVKRQDIGDERTPAAKRKGAEAASHYISLKSLLYPANDPDHQDHLHYATTTHAAALALARKIEGIQITPRFYVGELEGWRGRGEISSGHMVGSDHYIGLAGDANNRAGETAAEKADLNWLATWIQKGAAGKAFSSAPSLNAGGIVGNALRGVNVPLFPGALRPVGPAAGQLLGKGLLGQAQDWIGDMGAGYGGGGNVAQWVTAGLALAGAPSSWFSLMMQRVQRESTGNPLARNMGAGLPGGIPSGLTQIVVPGTWNAYARAGWDWRNPIQNIATSAIYSRSRYNGFGPISPYYNGGWIPEPVIGFGRSGRTYSFNEKGQERVVKHGHDGAAMPQVVVQINNPGPGTDVGMMKRLAREGAIEALEEYEALNR